MSSTTFLSLALSFAISSSPLVAGFSPNFSISGQTSSSSTQLKYRSLHHGPDIEPPSDIEKQGSAYTKMDKSMIDRFGPGDFSQYVDNDLFEGGDSEMGLVGDGSLGIQKVGRDALPHMARTFAAQMDQALVQSMSYNDELLQNNPGMDSARAQQLENWATQNEIAMSNRYMYGNDNSQDYYTSEYEYSDVHESFAYPLEAGGESEGMITLRAPVRGVAAQDIMVRFVASQLMLYSCCLSDCTHLFASSLEYRSRIPTWGTHSLELASLETTPTNGRFHSAMTT